MERYEPDPTAWRQMVFRPMMAARSGPGGRPETEMSESYSGVVEVAPGVEAFIGAQSMGDRGWWGKVEFNPSRVVDPDGASLATVGGALDAAARAWGAAAALVTAGCDLAEARVKRIDVARDFGGVERPGQLIRSLGPVHRPYSRRNLVHADPSRNGAQTLMVGSGAGVVRLYDKAAESPGKAPEGTVRWEAECRGWAKNYGAMKYLRDVTDQTVSDLARDRWEWSAMGVEVAATSRVVEKVRRSDLTRREQTMFLGFLVDQAHGGAWLPSSRTLAKFRRVQRQLGIAVGELGGDEDAGALGFVSRLDWESGREVSRAA